jgi:NAD(P)-dependent dehydrogenase (short-subunit alcohol dehydrogenase family)
VNAVIANAGIAGPWDAVNGKFTSTPPSLSELQAHLWSTSAANANEVSAVNVIAAYFTFLAFLPLLEAGNTHESSPGKSGYVPSQFITTSSIAGYSRANMVGYPYGASKAALTHLTKMLSTEFAGYGIRVNGIAPGFFRTEATEVCSLYRLF